MFKPFFVHKFFATAIAMLAVKQVFADAGEGPIRRGFTVHVQPDPNNVRNVIVRVAVCSKKDAFCKRLGRVEALAAEPQIIPARKLDKFLSDLHVKHMHMLHDFMYLYKFMV